jgi:hypothetical protein
MLDAIVRDKKFEAQVEFRERGERFDEIREG